MPYQSGPVNIQQGNDASFVVEYFDDAGVYTFPATGSVVVTYTNTSNVQTTETVTLSAVGRFMNGVWSTATAALGLATWTVYANGSALAQQGQIRVIERQGA